MRYRIGKHWRTYRTNVANFRPNRVGDWREQRRELRRREELYVQFEFEISHTNETNLVLKYTQFVADLNEFNSDAFTYIVPAVEVMPVLEKAVTDINDVTTLPVKFSIDKLVHELNARSEILLQFPKDA